MNINSVNYVNRSDNMRTASINIKSNQAADTADTAKALFANGAVEGIGRTTSTDSMVQSARALMQEADDVIEQLKQSASDAQGSLKALVRKLSGMDCVKLDEDGYGLNDTEPDKIVTVVERIKIMLATYCDGYEPAGQDIDIDDVKAVVGNTAAAGAIADKFSQYDVPLTDENLEDTKNAINEFTNTGSLTEDAKYYLVKNEMNPTIDNIYNAVNKAGSSEGAAAQLKDSTWQQLVPQVEDIIIRAGLDLNERNMSVAKGFLAQNIPVTDDNLVYMSQLDELASVYEALAGGDEQAAADAVEKAVDAIARSLSEGGKACDASMADTQTAWEQTAQAMAAARNADEIDVRELLRSGNDYTLGNLALIIEKSRIDNQDANTQGAAADSQNGEHAGQGRHSAQQIAQCINDMNADEIKAYRQLEEVRILMTADAGLSLAKQGFNLNTAPIAELVEELKKAELALAGIDDEAEAYNVYRTCEAVYNVAQAPADTIGMAVAELAARGGSGAVITLGELAQQGSSGKERYRRAGQTYEAVGTQIRSDLGDSLSKAVAASADDMLDNLGYEHSRNNREAVNILAANGMEITAENIDKVKEASESVKNLVNNAKPEAVLKMIRDGINPMDTDINELSRYLNNIVGQNAADEKYSTFLYKLDRTHGITEEERRQFIGIYKMMNIFTKDAGKAAGALVQQGSDMTMSNLMAMYNSRRAAGIDSTIDDNSGFAEIEGNVNYYNTLFTQHGYRITPATLKSVNDEKPIDSRMVEEFIDAVDDNYDVNLEAEYYQDYLNAAAQAAEADESIIAELGRFDMNASVGMINAMQQIMQYGWNSPALSVSSRMNGEKSSDVLKDAGRLLDAAGDKKAAEEIIDRMQADAREALAEAVDNVTEYQDLEDIRMRCRQIGIIAGMARKHEYVIPFDNDGQTGTIRLQLVQDESDAGRISVETDTAAYGHVSVQARMGKDSISIFAITDGDANKLTDAMERLKDSFNGDNSGEHNMGVTYTCVSSDTHADVKLPVSSDNIPTEELYTFAKKIVVALTA